MILIQAQPETLGDFVMKTLLELFDKHNTDKGSKKHFYDKVYEQHFKEIRYDPINILEIGVFKGESTAALHEYFPNATIYAMDIFVRQQADEINILKEPRVKHLKADSLAKTTTKLVKDTWDDVKFDIIIDDGAHWPEANRLTFRHLISFLKDNGKYFVEDVWPFDIMTDKQLSDPWLLKDPVKYNQISYANFLNELESYNTTLYDERQKPSGKFIGDSAILMVTK